jgi:3-dehydroquinate synthase
MRTIDIKFELQFKYAVHFVSDIFSPSESLLASVVAGCRSSRRLAFVVDDGVARHHPNLLGNIEQYCRHHALDLPVPPVVVPGGETVKNNQSYWEEIHNLIDRARLCRQSCLVVVGGGAVLDAAGFAAGTAHRGIRLVRVPTTVLSQNDSGVGVKNGINFFGQKNYLGMFAPPFAVINDELFLHTLEDRDWRSGIAEAIKVALVKDPAFFDFLEREEEAIRNRDMASAGEMIFRCAQLHLEHIAGNGDPFERGASRPLDFGHWAAHKLESLSQNRLRHGEAVAIGIALDSTYSHLAGFLNDEDWRRIMDLIVRMGLPAFTHELLDERLLDGLEDFRVHLGGALTIMLLQGIGRGIEVGHIDFGLMKTAIRMLQESYAAERYVSGPKTPNAHLQTQF